MATSSKKVRKPASSKASATSKAQPRKTAASAAKKPAAASKSGKNTKAPVKSKKTAKPAAKTTVKTAVKSSAKSAVKPKPAAAVAKPKALKALPKSPLMKVIESALGDMKAVDVKVLDVRGMTDVADNMVIASGNSDRHVRAIAENVVSEAKKAGFRPMGTEGERDGEWALVDLRDVIVHVMLPRVREFYRLESLWDISAARREATQG